MMLKVGLTGGIGSGKTTVANVFNKLGIPVFYADLEARKLMEHSQDMIQAIKSYFGEEAYIGNELNRKYLSGIVFSDPTKLKKLNQITHPAVHQQFEKWSAEHKDATYLIQEAALIFESGAAKYFDHIILILAPLEIRIDRVVRRDGIKHDEVRSRIASQMSDEEKIPLSDFLIFNDEQSMVVNQVMAFHEKMISLNKN